MHYFENAVAEINDIAILKQALRRRRLDAVALGPPALRHSIEHLLGRIFVGESEIIARIGQDRRFRLMHGPNAEFVMTADVIEMRMACDRDERAFAHQSHMLPEAHMAEA